MSLVHNIVLMVGVSDWGDDDENRAGDGVMHLKKWLIAHTHGNVLAEISDHTQGHKALEIDLYASGANYLPIEEFLQAFYSIEWNNASEVVLMIAPQEGAFEVYRPKGALEFQRPYEKCAGCHRYVYEHDRTNNGANCLACEPDYEDD